MKTDTGFPLGGRPDQTQRRILGWPGTRHGWWSVALAVAFLALFTINATVFMQLPMDLPWRHTLLPFYGILMLLCGLSSGIFGLVALVRGHERSWLVWLSILLGLMNFAFLLGEFLTPS